jgi:hypothetical protein
MVREAVCLSRRLHKLRVEDDKDRIVSVDKRVVFPIKDVYECSCSSETPFPEWTVSPSSRSFLSIPSKLQGALTAPLPRGIREAVGVIRLVENDRKGDLTLFDSGGIVEEAKCSCGTDDETVRHVLCVCPLWAVQRKTLQAVAGDRWGDVSYLLGGWGKRRDAKSGKLLDGEKDNWRPNLTVVKATVQYLQETGRLTYQPEEGQVG